MMIGLSKKKNKKIDDRLLEIICCVSDVRSRGCISFYKCNVFTN